MLAARCSKVDEGILYCEKESLFHDGKNASMYENQYIILCLQTKD